MSIKNWVGDKVTDFIYDKIQDKMNSRGDKMPKNVLEHNEYILREAKVWFSGNEEEIADFYECQNSSMYNVDVRNSYFYSNVDNCIRVVHSGIPSLLSYTKAKILLQGGIEYAVEEKEEIDEFNSERLDYILKSNDIEKKITEGAVDQSWGKKFAFKISYDSELADFPILEVYDALNYEKIERKGITLGFIFKNYYTVNKTDYELHEYDEKGKITYLLYQVTDNGLMPVPLDEIEETAMLQDIEFKGDFIMAEEIELVKSDYNGLISEFDALDETWSNSIDEIRLGKAESYIPDILQGSNANGTVKRTFDSFRKKYIITETDESENGKNEIKHNQADIRIEQYKQAINMLVMNMLNVVGISPLTIGIEDNLGANASGTALEKREKATLRTRQQLIKEWQRGMVNICNKLLKADDVFKGNTINEYDSKFNFGEYVVPDRMQMVDEILRAVELDVLDVNTALIKLYGEELSEEERQEIITNVGVMVMGDETEEEE